MTVVRELIAVLGVDLDDRDVKKVDNAVSRFEDRMRRVGEFIGGSLFIAGIARAANAVVQMASDAQEQMNVVNEVFAGNQAQVLAWSRTMAGELGRSEFLLLKLAGDLGKVLNPLMEGNAEAAAKMSTGLAQLAVDLSSFNNISEDDALIKLRSAIVGETEAIKSLGVIMTEVNLKAFALGQGLNYTKVKADQAALTQLRYDFILSKTLNAQGDAARTANDHANAQRAAGDAVRDLATRIGNRLLPAATRLLIWVRDGTRGFIELTNKSHILEAALIAMGVAMAAVGVLMAAALLPVLVPLAKAAVAIATLTLLLDEAITFWKGGKTAIGEYIDALFGIGEAQATLDDHKAGLEILSDEVWPAITESVKQFARDSVNLWNFLKEKWAEFTDYIGEQWQKVLAIPGIGGALETVINTANEAAAIAERSRRVVSPQLTDEELEFLGFGPGAAEQRQEIRQRPVAVGRGTRSGAIVARQGSTGAQVRLRRAQQLEEKKQREGLSRTEQVELQRIVDIAPSSVTTPSRPALASSVINQVSAPITIHQADDPAQVEQAVKRGIQSALSSANGPLQGER